MPVDSTGFRNQRWMCENVRVLLQPQGDFAQRVSLHNPKRSILVSSFATAKKSSSTNNLHLFGICFAARFHSCGFHTIFLPAFVIFSPIPIEDRKISSHPGCRFSFVSRKL